MVQQKTGERNEYGEQLSQTDGEWVDWIEVWAKVEPLVVQTETREVTNAEQQQVTIRSRVRMRYLPGLNEAKRIKLGNRIFNIDSVMNVNEANREHRLLCIEVKNDKQ